MVRIRYDDGTGDPAIVEPLDEEFEFVSRGAYWLVKVGVEDGENLMKVIPDHRVYDIEGLRAEIRPARP
jgi:hypothetical protein